MRTIAVFLLLAASVFAQGSKIISSDLGGRELTFLNKANEHDMVLIYLSELAKTKGSTDAVRALGDLIGTTQTKEHEHLVALARTKAVSFPPGQPGSISRMQNLLGTLEKGAFDRAWLSEVSGILQASIQNYTTGSSSSDSAIKKFAEPGLDLANRKLDAVKKVAAR